MFRLLTWNVYHGALAGVTPAQRIAQIANFGAANGIDVILLQEVPQASLPGAASGEVAMAVNNCPLWGVINAAGAWGTYRYLYWRRETTNQAPALTNTADGYLFLVNPANFAAIVGGPGTPSTFAQVRWIGYLAPGNFLDIVGRYFRPPVGIRVSHGGHDYYIYNWHSEAAAVSATAALDCLELVMGVMPHSARRTVVAGDFNIRQVPGAYFVGWDDLAATYHQGHNVRRGLDHILGSTNVNSQLGHLLNFTSDAYHYPVCGNIT